MAEDVRPHPEGGFVRTTTLSRKDFTACCGMSVMNSIGVKLLVLHQQGSR
jgi:hypothetical protein